MNINTKILSENDLDIAAKIIKKGGLVVFPTETVYGIGANALVDSAVEKIYLAKNRPSNNPLIVHLANIEDVEKHAVTNQKFYELSEKFMPGALTVILKSKNTISKIATANLETVAIRIPQNPIAQKLIELSEVPIVAPSANLSGRPSATSAKHIIEELNSKVDAIIDSENCKIGLESTIVLLSETPVLLRPGSISPEELKTVLPNLQISDGVLSKLPNNTQILSPGLLHKHYSPNARCQLILSNLEQFENFIKNKTNKDFSIIGYEEEKHLSKNFVSIGKYSDTTENAKLLFDALRKVDNENFVYIHFQKDISGISLAIYNRLIRAVDFNITQL